MIFGNLGNMGEMMNMAREMQKNLSRVKEELKQEMFPAESGGVKVVISGEMELKELKIDGSEMSNQARLEKNVKDAVAKALRDAKDGAARKMKNLTGGINLPGLL